MGNDQYFAHGLGILTAEQIIQRLNSLRKNAVQPAYLLNQATRLDAPALYQIMH